MWKKRLEDASYDFREDFDIMEEYWQNNNIKYDVIDLPKEEVYL